MSIFFFEPVPMSNSGQLFAAGAMLLVGGGAAAYAGVYGGALTNRAFQPLPTEAERIARFDMLAPTWDVQVFPEEDKHGIWELRQRLLAHVPPNARALETAAGTGRNIPLYPPGSHVILTDASEGMITECEATLRDFLETAAKEERTGTLPEFEVKHVDAQHLPYSRGSFDCVVDTFGLCSVTNPRTTLDEMFRVLKPGGTLLLLEHGQSDYTPVSWWQRITASQHLHDWGCFYNRPMKFLVEDSKFIVEELDRKHAGTTVLVRATRPAAVEDLFAEAPPKKRWWFW